MDEDFSELTDETKEEFESRVNASIKEIMLDVRRYAAKGCIVWHKPKVWIKVVQGLLRGEPYKKIAARCKTTFHLVKRVEAQLLETRLYCDLKREMAVRIIEAMDVNFQIGEKAKEALLNKYEKMFEDKSIEDMPLEILHRNVEMIDRNQAQFGFQLERLRGDAPPPQQINHVVSYDKMLAEIDAARNKEKKMIQAEPVEILEITEIAAEELAEEA